jgi:alkanesulfonate monooxygenase SsuD/methylene tetrahydromethanopterin reductase-like flavin-dependent oxidoreductase (luciferase family)
MKARARAAGRNPEHMKILPGVLVFVGRTHAEAEQKRELLDSLVHPDSSLPNLSMRLGVDASRFDLDAPLPDIPQSNASQSARDALVALARRDNLTVRQLAQLVGGHGGLQMVGTAGEIADTMQEWLETEASDGFNIMFPTVPAGLDDFVDMVVPELQRRGLFRREYEGTTLRDHLGLPRPDNRFFADTAKAAE